MQAESAAATALNESDYDDGEFNGSIDGGGGNDTCTHGYLSTNTVEGVSVPWSWDTVIHPLM